MMSMDVFPAKSESGSKHQGRRLPAQTLWAGFCAALLDIAIAAPSALADSETYAYVGSNGTVYLTHVPADQRFAKVSMKRQYYASVFDQELEEAVHGMPMNIGCRLRCCLP